MEIAASTTGHATPTTADVQSKATSRLFFVDNIRVLLTILVVLFQPCGLVELWERIREAIARRANRKESQPSPLELEES